MKITILTPADSLTGGSRVIATHARLLQQRGHEVLIVSNAPDTPPLRELLSRFGRPDRLPRADDQRVGHLALSGVPHRVLERKRAVTADDLPDADVVIATWWETAEWMHRLPASKGQRVHLIQGYEVWAGSPQARVHAALGLPNLKIVISQSLADELHDKVDPALPLCVVPNAVDLDIFHAAPRARGRPATVGFIVANEPFKGTDLCIEACRLAMAAVPDLRVIAFGTVNRDPLRPLPAGAEFSLRPRQADLAAIYGRCDAWLYGSRIDSFGLPILEAMACRTPVIAVPTGAAPVLLANGGGRLLSGYEPQDMADALVALLTGTEVDWVRHSIAAWRQAQSYTWDDAATLMEALLGSLVDERQAA